MRIAIVTDSYYPTRDGVVTTVVSTKAALEERGHEVLIVAPDPGEEYREEGVHYCSAVKFKSYDGYFRPRVKCNKIPEIEEFHPDIIHIHGVAVMALKGLYTSHAYHIPTVLTFITMVNEVASQYSPVRMPKATMKVLVGIYLRNLLKRPDAIVVPTPSIAKELRSISVRPKSLEIIPIGVDVDRFCRNGDGDAIRRRYGTIGRKVAIVVGRLAAEKNIGLVIRSVRYLDADTTVMIVGKGPMESELKELAVSEGVSDRVIFTGFVSDEELVSYYSSADISVSASKFETQGLTTLESMSCGLPAICANGRAFTDVIEEGINGYLFECTEKDCSEAVKKGFRDMDRMRIGARDTAERYSIGNTADSLVKLYARISESDRPPKPFRM